MPAFWPILVQSLLAPTPSATDSPWTLEWSAPADCPSAAEVDGIVARWRAQAPPTSTAPNVRARGQIEARASGGFALQLEIDADGVVTSHAVEAEDCRALADATALQVAMALGLMPETPPQSSETTTDAAPSAIPTPTPEVTSPSPPPARTPASAPATAPRTAEPARRRRPLALRGALRLQGGAGTGRVPRVDGRLGLGGALLWARARIDVVVAHTFLQPREHPDRDGLVLRVWQWTALARGCWTPHVGPIELPLCGGLEAGASRATSRGVERHRTATSPFVAAVLTGALAWPFARRFALWVEVDGWVGLTQPAFTVEDLPPWFVTRRGGVDGAIGLEVRFP